MGKQISQMQAVAPQVQQFSSSGRKFCVNNVKMWQFFPIWPPKKMSPRCSVAQWFQFCKTRVEFTFSRDVLNGSWSNLKVSVLCSSLKTSEMTVR